MPCSHSAAASSGSGASPLLAEVRLDPAGCVESQTEPLCPGEQVLRRAASSRLPLVLT
jgi:hypothetical protein